MAEELSEPCASIAFMTNLVYDRGVALEYDLVHDRLEDAERRVADLEDMMPQVYGLTDLTTPEERADLVRALGKVKRYIQEGDALMGQGAADEFNASFRNIMWNIIIRCKERVKQQPWLSPKEVVEHGSYVIFTNLDTGETKQYFNIFPPDSQEVVSAAMLIKPYLEKRWGRNLKFEIVPAEKLPGEQAQRSVYPKEYKGYIIDTGVQMPSYDIYEYDIFETSEQHEQGSPVHTSESEGEAEAWIDRQVSLGG